MNLNIKKSTIIFSAVILIAVIFINLIGRNWFLRFDLTDNKMYSLSSSSKSVVQKIDDLFTIKVYFSADLPAQYSNNKRYLQDILEEYTAYSSGNLRFEFYSPENEEQIAEDAQKYGIQPVQLQVIENDKVEIKTNPSSRFSAECSSRILNIILKKEKLKGLNGSINLNTGYPSQNGLSTNFNYRKSKFSVFASVNLSQRESRGGGWTNSDFYLSDTTYSSYIDRDRESNSKSIGGRVGFSFFPNKNNIFNFSLGLRSSDSDGDSKNIYTDFTTSGEQIGESKRFENSNRISDNYNYNISYTKNFKKRGHNLKLNYSWSNNDSKNFGSYNEPLINLNQRTNQESGRNDENIRVD